MTVKAVKEKEEIEEDSDVASQLPEPTGYKILIALPEANEKTEGGIVKAESTRSIEAVSYTHLTLPTILRV